MSGAHRERPGRYSEALKVQEFRALYLAQVASGIGDQVAKVALAILVFDRTSSPFLAALAYAAGFLPWIVAGPVLSPLADRLPRRRVMVVCELGRAVLFGAMALPGVSIPALFMLLLLASLLAPPFEAARAATLPDVLPGDLYVVGSSLGAISSQFVQVLGFAGGGALVALVGARGALGLDAVTFALSGLLLMVRVVSRPPAATGARPTLVADIRDGSRVVFASPVLRSILLLAWVGAAFSIVPEGLAVTYADSHGAGPVATGLLLAANPVGAVVGAFVIGRLVAPFRRLRLMLPLAALTFLPLLGTVVHPPVPLACLLWAVSGVGLAFQLPANATFVATVPVESRGRAFGLAQSGLHVFQGLSLTAGGALVQVLPVQGVVTLSGVVGLSAVALLARTWPHAALIGTPVPASAAADRSTDAEAEETEQPIPVWTGPYLLSPAPRELVMRLVALPLVPEPAVAEPLVAEP
ncbi:MAG TPA: MFS transporter [Mycobacteriales bacterium]|nr:MFS transporter [Mycobacteriales bacterium]